MSSRIRCNDLHIAAICQRLAPRQATALLCGYVVCCASIALGQLADSAWPDYGGGFKNQHRSPYAGPSSKPLVLWEFDLATIPTGQFNRGYHQPILLPDGTLVLNTADTSNDQIVALNRDGSLRWVVDDSSLGPWLAADMNGYIYTIRNTYSSSNTDRLRRIDFNGVNGWQINLTGSNNTQNGPAIGRDGNIYAAVDFGTLNAVTPAGSAAWTSTASGYYVNPAIAEDGTIIVGGKFLTALDSNGNIVWQKPARTASNQDPSYLSPAIGDNGTIYAGQNYYPNLLALTPSGAEIWVRTDLGGAPAIGLNGDIYVVPESGILHALSPIDGSTRWTYQTGKTDYYNSEGVTVDGRGNIYVANDKGILLSLTQNGEFRWQWDFAPSETGFVGISAPIIDSNGYLYVVGGNTGKVFAFALVPEPNSLALLFSAILLSWLTSLRRFGRNCSIFSSF